MCYVNINYELGNILGVKYFWKLWFKDVIILLWVWFVNYFLVCLWISKCKMFWMVGVLIYLGFDVNI